MTTAASDSSPPGGLSKGDVSLPLPTAAAAISSEPSFRWSGALISGLALSFLLFCFSASFFIWKDGPRLSIRPAVLFSVIRRYSKPTIPPRPPHPQRRSHWSTGAAAVAVDPANNGSPC